MNSYPKLIANLILTIALIVGGLKLEAQHAELQINVGPSVKDDRLAPGKVYDLWLFDVGYGKEVFPLGEKAGIALVAGMQYGHSQFIDQGKRQFDIAAQLAAQFVWHWKGGGLEVSVGSGPGYQSTSSPTQVKGFVFSNHGTAGLRIQLFREKVFLVPQYRFRHMSNASTRQPNHGIDNHFAMIGMRLKM